MKAPLTHCKNRRVQAWSSWIALALLLALAGRTFAQMKPGDVRKSYGDARASVIESVLTTLYPGAEVIWDPSLRLRLPGQEPRMVDVPVYVRGSAANGGLEGIASIELEKRKEQFIFEAQNFRRTDQPVFPTEMIVFRADLAGHIQRYKRFMLDPGEPLTEIKTMSIQDWSQDEWPTLLIQYDTHRVRQNSFTTIEWHGTFDVNSETFTSRLPFGFTRQPKGGVAQLYFLGLGRVDPGRVVMQNRLDGDRRVYACSDPCVMDADRLLAAWNFNDLPLHDRSANKGPANLATSASAGGASSSAIIHLKNGRTIHADSTHEVGDKLEYTMGESEYQIPKSMVQEIVHATDASPQSDNPNGAAPLSSQSQGADTPCSADAVMATPQIPCKVVFFVQTLMGLGETQRFSLIDNGNHDVTAQAQWSILDIGSEVDFSVVNGVPHVFSRKYGMVQLYATVGGKSAMTRIYILPPDELRSNTMGRKGSPMGRDAPLRIIIADPHVGRIQ